MPYLTGQQTPAVMSILGQLRGSRGPSRRRKSTRKVSKSVSRRRKRRSAAKKNRLVKGSAAAKAYMAKIRRMRRK